MGFGSDVCAVVPRGGHGHADADDVAGRTDVISDGFSLMLGVPFPEGVCSVAIQN